MNDVDVLVAGGGPVGLAAAIEARLAGLTVALVEPREGPIDKACGEGLMPGALPLLQRLGVDPAGMPLRGVSYRNASKRADHRFETGVGRGVRRTVLQSELADRASELGVRFVDGRVDGIEQDATGVSAAGVRASWLLACDGLHSGVRRTLGLDRPVRRGRRFGIRQHFEVAPWNDLIEVYWAEDAEVYVTPIAHDTVGIAMLGAQHADFDAVVRSIPELATALADAAPASTRRGAGPFRQRAARVRLGRVLLVGDASGYVDAITGEGLRLGIDQARVAVASLLGGAGYEREWRRVTRDFRVLTSGLVAAARSPLRGGIVPLAARLPRVYGAVVERLAR
ncbi:flavin-dependent dehydrogenase [Leifsonia sp. AK011]|uniref:NAD(P)/FAD-dependent oxidoreductase n=1 Tax=Leifsonia sp. AK011 TaxID=2723075 RepID=UPI0015CC5687|nr:NAD(P)/FAD-dependent oxidoreductase [Leifsonia sp. AK011]NYF09251.1 flavin-dependent dehydrogenase [Leifsonia sp. AK011]